jgi:hypothetical protein
MNYQVFPPDKNGRPQYTLLVPIPTVIDEYNQHMGGVDQANQYREAYTTHRPTQRNWFSLFYYGLDTALNNAYIIFTV